MVFLMPLYWMVVAALREPGLAPPRTVEWWPVAPHWDNFASLFRLLPMQRYLSNTLIVVAVAVPVTWLTASWAGFGLAMVHDPARRILLTLSVGLMMVPGASVWLFRYQILRWMGLNDTLWALILPSVAATNPLFVLLFYWTFQRVPAGLYDSAWLDGASVFAVWRKIGCPLARPATVAVIILAFSFYWSDFVGPVLYLFRPRWYTLPVGLQILKQMDATNWPMLMAAATLATLPVIVVFVWSLWHLLGRRSMAEVWERY